MTSVAGALRSWNGLRLVPVTRCCVITSSVEDACFSGFPEDLVCPKNAYSVGVWQTVAPFLPLQSAPEGGGWATGLSGDFGHPAWVPAWLHF